LIQNGERTCLRVKISEIALLFKIFGHISVIGATKGFGDELEESKFAKTSLNLKLTSFSFGGPNNRNVNHELLVKDLV